MNEALFAGKVAVITGGAGFIGSHLARALLGQGARVIIVDSMLPLYGGNLRNISDIRDDIQVNFSDLRDGHSMSFILDGADFVFNLAGQTSHLDSMTDPLTDLDINVAGQLRLLETLRRVSPLARVVFASTRQIYGRPRVLPVNETHPLAPVDINGIHKIAAESYHSLFSEVYGIRTTSLRLTNTYGPGMRVKDARQTFLGTWLGSAVVGKSFRVFGDGTQRRDFNYVGDVVEAFLLAATNDKAVGRIYNLGHEEVVSLIELAEIVVRHSPAGAKYELVAFPPDRKAIDIGDYYGDFSAASQDLNWRPSTSLASGISMTLAYLAQNLGNYLDLETTDDD